MLKLALNAALALGTDPITLTLVTFQSIVCAFLMRLMLRSSVGVFACTPILFVSGLLAAYIAIRVGYIDVPEVHIGEQGDWELDWTLAVKEVPHIVFSATAGIVAGALAIIGLLHEIQRHI